MKDKIPNKKTRRSAERWLRQAVKRIAVQAKPEKVILFGSCAYGRPRKDSDFDLLVILKKRDFSDRFRSYLRVENAVGEHRWPLDLLVRSRDEVESRLRIGDSFMAEIITKGTVLYQTHRDIR